MKLIMITLLTLLTLFADKRVDDLSKKIFLGAIFGSQNSYFISFKEKVTWPKALNAYDFHANLNVARVDKEAVIPSCSEKSYFIKKEKTLAGVDYFAKGFFNTILDDCVNEVLGKYQAKEKVDKAYNVIAFNPQIKPSNFSVKNQGKARILDASEIEPLAKLKAYDLKTEADYDCTTENKYIDSAKIVLEFELNAMQGRLSHYLDAGCSGHLADKYVLDFLKDGRLIKSYKTYHYQGAI